MTDERAVRACRYAQNKLSVRLCLATLDALYRATTDYCACAWVGHSAIASNESQARLEMRVYENMMPAKFSVLF